MSDYNIKVTGDAQTYGDGATRNSKEGKGRFDLIPLEPFTRLLDLLDNLDFVGGFVTRPKSERMRKVYSQALNENYATAIIMIALFDLDVTDAECPDEDVMTMTAILEMMKDLAIHFEKGAKIYGEHNCEKGIPLWSFRDSGIRHLTQFLLGETDENHEIAAIWNFWMAEWTIIMTSKSE